MPVVSLAAACSPTRWLKAACRALYSQRRSRQWPRVPRSVPDSSTYARKLPRGPLRFKPGPNERSTPASTYCLTSVTFLRSSMRSPRWSRRCCRWYPLVMLSMSTSRPFWLVVWFSGTRCFGRLLFRDFAGNRWAIGQRLLKSQIDRPLVLRDRSRCRARHTGSRQLFLVAGLYRLTLTDPSGDVPGSGREKVRVEPPWLSRVMPSGHQLPSVSIRRSLMSRSRTSRCSNLDPCRLPTAMLTTTWLVVLVLLVDLVLC